ncbi:MAG: sensor histidine kinase N-terminal domain-containing protein [Thalassovita sp.]
MITIAAFAYGRNAARQSFDRILLGAANDISESITILEGAPIADIPVSAFGLLGLAQGMTGFIIPYRAPMAPS